MLTLSVNSYGQKPIPTAELDSTLLLIGDQVRLKFQLDCHKDQEVFFPAFRDTIIKGVEVVQTFPVDTIRMKSGRMRLIQEHLITSFDTGLHVIPRIPFFVKKNKSADTVFSNMLAMQVVTFRVDTATAFFDIKPQIKTPLIFAEIAVETFIGIAILLFIAIAVYIVLRYRNKKPIFKREKPKEPAHIIAFRDLDELADEKLWQQGLIKEYYTKLTDIFRVYIENRYNIAALEQTSDEILASLTELKAIDKELMLKVKDCLYLSDMAKFAKMVPVPEDNEYNYKTVQKFVQKTLVVDVKTSAESDKDGDTVVVVPDVKPEQGEEEVNNVG
jgi:hypothetical protein